MKVSSLYAALGLKVDGAAWKQGTLAITGLGRALAAVISYKAISALGGMVTATMAVGDAAVNMSKKLGIGIESIQELNFAASQSGSSGEALNASLGRLAVGLQEAKRGTGPVRDAMRTLGISMRELDGQSLDQNLEVIAERFKGMPDGPKKAALAVQLFGRAGKDLIPLLNEGAGGIAKLRNEARDLGGVIDGQTAQGLDDLGDTVDKVKFSLAGLRNNAIKALLPMLTELAEKLVTWIKANRELITQKLVAIVKGLVSAVEGVAKAVSWVIDNWDLVKAAVAAVVAPFAAIGATIAVVIRVVKKIVSAVSSFGDKAREVASGIAQWFRETWDSVTAGVRTVANAIASPFVAAFDAVKAAGVAVIDWIAGKIDWVLDKLEWVKGQADRFINGTAEGRQVMFDAMGISREQAASLSKSKQATASPRTGGASTTPAMPWAPVAMTPARTSSSSQVSITGGINVTVPPGADAAEYAQAVDGKLREFFAGEMRSAFAGTGAP